MLCFDLEIRKDDQKKNKLNGMQVFFLFFFFLMTITYLEIRTVFVIVCILSSFHLHV